MLRRPCFSFSEIFLVLLGAETEKYKILNSVVSYCFFNAGVDMTVGDRLIFYLKSMNERPSCIFDRNVQRSAAIGIVDYTDDYVIGTEYGVESSSDARLGSSTAFRIRLHVLLDQLN